LGRRERHHHPRPQSRLALSALDPGLGEPIRFRRQPARGSRALTHRAHQHCQRTLCRAHPFLGCHQRNH
jgi:hypothetical protein